MAQTCSTMAPSTGRPCGQRVGPKGVCAAGHPSRAAVAVGADTDAIGQVASADPFGQPAAGETGEFAPLSQDDHDAWVAELDARAAGLPAREQALRDQVDARFRERAERGKHELVRLERQRDEGLAALRGRCAEVIDRDLAAQGLELSDADREREIEQAYSAVVKGGPRSYSGPTHQVRNRLVDDWQRGANNMRDIKAKFPSPGEYDRCHQAIRMGESGAYRPQTAEEVELEREGRLVARAREDAQLLRDRGLRSDAMVLRDATDRDAIAAIARRHGSTNVSIVHEDGSVERVTGFGHRNGTVSNTGHFTMETDRGSSYWRGQRHSNTAGGMYDPGATLGEWPDRAVVVVDRPFDTKPHERLTADGYYSTATFGWK